MSHQSAKTVPSKTPKRTSRRPAKRGDWKQTFLQKLTELGSVSAAATAAGVSRASVYEARRNDGEFIEAMREAREYAVEAIESTLYQRAREGELPALTFYLKGHKPEVYGNRMLHEEREKIRLEAREEVMAQVRAEIRKLPKPLRQLLYKSVEADDQPQLPPGSNA